MSVDSVVAVAASSRYAAYYLIGAESGDRNIHRAVLRDMPSHSTRYKLTSKVDDAVSHASVFKGDLMLKKRLNA